MVFYGLGAVQSSSRVDNNCPLIGIRSTLDGWTDWHDMALGSSAHVHCYFVVNNNGKICPSSLSWRVQFEPVAKLSVQYGQLFGMACIWIVPKWLIKVSWIVHLSLIEIVDRVQLNPGYIVPRRHFANWMRLRVICIGLVPIAIVLPPADQPILCLLWWANKNTQSTLWPRKWASSCNNCSTHGIANDVCQMSDMNAFVCILLPWWRPMDINSRKGWNYYIMTIAIDVAWPWIRILKLKRIIMLQIGSYTMWKYGKEWNN